ncbi:hypothetical protein MD484_g6786, partial [Candolleomyces efflorescens]
MSNPFTLFGMARRATANLRQMTSSSTLVASSSSENLHSSDTASISSATKRRAFSPLLLTRKPSLAVVDSINATSSLAASPPAAARAVLSDVASNASSSMLVTQEPTSASNVGGVILSESPRMEPAELSKSVDSVDYFSSLPRNSTSADPNEDLGESSALDAVIEELKLAKQRLEEQIQLLAVEKRRVEEEFEILSHKNQRLESEMEEDRERWAQEKEVLTAERDQERGAHKQEKTSLLERVRDLTNEKEGLIEEMGQKQAKWDRESAWVAEEMVREMDLLGKEKGELERRLVTLESTVIEKEGAEKRLEGAVAVLMSREEDNARTMRAQEQHLNAARDNLMTLQAQIQAVTAEGRHLAQQLKNEKEARDAERARVSKESSDERQQFEEEKRALSLRITGLEQGLGAQEKARKRLEDDVVFARREKEESTHFAVSLQQQLTAAKAGTKRLQETAEARVNSLQKGIDSLRQDRERQIVLRDSQIKVLNAKVDQGRKGSVPGGPIQVTFSVRAETVRGENIFITGSIDPLKRWSPEDAIALKPTNYPIWSVTLPIPANTQFSYKYVRKFNGGVRWESDPNCSYSSPAFGVATIRDIWR